MAELHADGLIDDDQLDAALTDAYDAHEDAIDRIVSWSDPVAGCSLADAVRSLTQPPSSVIPQSGREVPYDGWHALAMISEALARLRPQSVIEAIPYIEGDIIFTDGKPYTTLLSLQEQIAQADLVRDIFGNPFRETVIRDQWLTIETVGIARKIYEDRAFDQLTYLANALDRAGCENESILAHCHSDKPHVRGCWVVDLLLRKN